MVSGVMRQHNGSAALEARNITRSLPLGRERIDILHGISFRINRGEFVAIIGPSGSGKSTVLGIIAGLDSPTGGQVHSHFVASSLATMHFRPYRIHCVKPTELGSRRSPEGDVAMHALQRARPMGSACSSTIRGNQDRASCRRHVAPIHAPYCGRKRLRPIRVAR